MIETEIPRARDTLLAQRLLEARDWADGMHLVRVPIRVGHCVSLLLPRELSKREAEKCAAVVAALADERISPMTGLPSLSANK